MVLEKLGQSLNKTLRKLIGISIIDEDLVKDIVKQIQRALLEADINVELVLALSKNIEEKSLKEDLPVGITRREHIVKVVYDELASILGGKRTSLEFAKGKTQILMLVGIQGSGKTTQAVKIANYYQKRGIKSGLVAADTYRPGAYDQLFQLAEKANISVFGDSKEKNAVKVAKKGIQHFKKEKAELIIVDTAGRHKEEKGLIKEMQSISKAVSPDEIVLVIDGTIGQQAAAQATAFRTAAKIGSIIVTKLDGSARGGGALSAAAAAKVPIKFVGVGEKIEDIEIFKPTVFVGRLLGMGDIQGLLEKVKDAQIIPDKDASMRLLTGRFTLDDFYVQMQNLKKIGPMKKILSMMGAGYKIPDNLQDVAEDRLEKYKVIIQSMTPAEKIDPKKINFSRAQRIARGSGTEPQEVRELIKQYNQSKNMIKQLSKNRRARGRGGLPPGLDSMMGR
ncbi:MAG: signal recognition particle receptor subunit alpha [Candidatus Ranarchaeia archaeon]